MIVPYSFERTRLFTDAFADRPHDADADIRIRFREALLRMRSNASALAGEISISMPHFTMHDVTHLDALWDMADIITGPDISLTPTEAFVLGGGFLLHDLGMGLAAYPGGLAALQSAPGWRDLVASTFLRLNRRLPSTVELESPPDDIIGLAVRQSLRERHAAEAERLVTRGWQSGVTTLHLLPDDDLRIRLGPLMGQLARSHWADVDSLIDIFGSRPFSLPDTPPDWTVDRLGLACLLRLSDAAQLDIRRAPIFLHALRDLPKESDDHWNFQERLERPYPDQDRIVYTSVRPFEAELADAWWLAFDSIRMVDAELRKVDALLFDHGRSRFAMRGVSGVETSRRFRRHVPTVDWLPLSAELRVDDVPRLVEQLGGRALYGARPAIGLRELIQNSADAIFARESLEPGFNGDIEVKLWIEGDQWFLEVGDNGVGMSQEVLTNVLLDFGESLWQSDGLRGEFPGLLSSGWEPIGKFGIGFYATFLLGDNVVVTSNRYDAAATDTQVLEFRGGVVRRPLLRPATDAERILHGGTRVKIRLRHEPGAPEGLLDWEGPDETLYTLCLSLCPTLGVSLDVSHHPFERVRVIEADDWKDMPARLLFERLYPRHRLVFSRNYDDSQTEFASRVTDIRRDGELLARMAYVSRHDWRQPSRGVMTVGGLAADTGTYGLLGVMTGEPLRAARDTATPVATDEEFEQWAIGQAETVKRLGVGRYAQLSAAITLRPLAIDIDLPLASQNGDLLSPSELRSWSEGVDDVLLVTDHAGWYEFPAGEDNLVCADLSSGRTIQFMDQVLWYFGDLYSGIQREPPINRSDEHYRPDPGLRRDQWDWRAIWYMLSGTPAALVVRCIADAWDCTVDDLMSQQEFDFTRREANERVIGKFEGTEESYYAETLHFRRP